MKKRKGWMKFKKATGIYRTFVTCYGGPLHRTFAPVNTPTLLQAFWGRYWHRTAIYRLTYDPFRGYTYNFVGTQA